MGLFCASEATTAVCSSVGSRHSKKPADRRSPALHARPTTPSSSQLPLGPNPYHEASRKSCAQQTHRKSSASREESIVSPNSSSRYLLNSSSTPIFDAASEPESVSESLDSSSHSRSQVVVLLVSLHCKGCERKVRKRISKIDGVASFSTDLASKKVTVIGDVTPLGVLESVSQVKGARLLHPQL